MPQNVTVTIENNFSAGFKTEFTGLNFPPHAATETDNCIYDIVGDVTRREGFDYEENFQVTTINRAGCALSTYKWNNVGGDGLTQLLVEQVGSTLYFYSITNSSTTSPISTNKLVSTVDITAFIPTGSTLNPKAVECQYSDGNGYLFVFHPGVNPFYCAYNNGVVTGTAITLQVRDFTGIPDNLGVSERPATLSAEHNYNLQNQGWTAGSTWTDVTTDNSAAAVGSVIHFNITSAAQPIVLGDRLHISYYPPQGNFPSGYQSQTYIVVNSYVGTLVTGTVYAYFDNFGSGSGFSAGATVVPVSTGYINTWKTAIGNYPSNSDVWWRYKDSTDVFNPTSTIGNVTLSTGPAPKGHYVMSAFNLNYSAASGIAGLTSISTNARPRTGTWFQGRVWYAGVDASQQPTGDAQYFTWTENIYFSQTVVDATDFGQCYQDNDPTSENLFDILPSDGGVITIQGCGSVYKLFPIQNGLLVFAANGIWFITGSQGIGFTATDYTITKISQIQSASSTSFVNVQGLPYFWNEEGIYTIVSAQQGLGLQVESLTVSTILSFYADIPYVSKRFARGDYNPIDYIIQWCYRSTPETSVTDRYQFDKILIYNTYTKAFYTYTLPSTSSSFIHGINYISGPGGSVTFASGFKYPCSLFSSSTGSYYFTFADEHDDGFIDWRSNGSGGVNFVSSFTTGYRLAGQALKSFQPSYVYVFSRQNGVATGYKIQGIWDYADDRSSGKYSGIQRIINGLTRFGMVYRKHRIRGHGLALQLKFISVDGMPFDFMGWTAWETQNASI